MTDMIAPEVLKLEIRT